MNAVPGVPVEATEAGRLAIIDEAALGPHKGWPVPPRWAAPRYALAVLAAALPSLREVWEKPIRELHTPWYEINGVRHDHRVMVGWDEAPDDHVCVIGPASRLDACDPGDQHAVLACAECRASGGDDIDVAHYPFWPCATIAALSAPVQGGAE